MCRRRLLKTRALGGWQSLGAKFEVVQLPPHNWRTEATALLKAGNISYITGVVQPPDSLFADMLRRPAEWHVKEVFRTGDAAVFRLE